MVFTRLCSAAVLLVVFAASGVFAQTISPPPPTVPLVGSGHIALDQITGRAQIKMPDEIPESVCREITKTGSDWRDPTQEMILSRCAELGR
jgi:hypothetical protein